MIANITVTNIGTNPDGSTFGFGVNELGEGVYIPVSCMNAAGNPNVGDSLSAVLSDNANNNRGSTPWFCSIVNNPTTSGSKKEGNDNPPDQRELRGAIIEYINAQDWMVTGNEVAECVGCSQQFASATLHNLHTQEKISKISISKGPDRKASHAAWCRTALTTDIFHEMICGDDW